MSQFSFTICFANVSSRYGIIFFTEVPSLSQLVLCNALDTWTHEKGFSCSRSIHTLFKDHLFKPGECSENFLHHRHWRSLRPRHELSSALTKRFFHVGHWFRIEYLRNPRNDVPCWWIRSEIGWWFITDHCLQKVFFVDTQPLKLNCSLTYTNMVEGSCRSLQSAGPIS